MAKMYNQFICKLRLDEIFLDQLSSWEKMLSNVIKNYDLGLFGSKQKIDEAPVLKINKSSNLLLQNYDLDFYMYKNFDETC